MQANKIIWFTGLSGSGKTTLAHGLESYLKNKKVTVKIIDGDAIRENNKINSFDKVDIINNNERIIELCKKLQMEYDYLLVTVIAPFNQTRQKARRIFAKNYIEVYLKADLEIVIKRDTKGLYEKALAGKLNNMIGLDPIVPYEEPDRSEIVINTGCEKPEESLNRLIKLLDLV